MHCPIDIPYMGNLSSRHTAPHLVDQSSQMHSSSMACQIGKNSKLAQQKKKKELKDKSHWMPSINFPPTDLDWSHCKI